MEGLGLYGVWFPAMDVKAAIHFYGTLLAMCILGRGDSHVTFCAGDVALIVGDEPRGDLMVGSSEILVFECDPLSLGQIGGDWDQVAEPPQFTEGVPSRWLRGPDNQLHCLVANRRTGGEAGAITPKRHAHPELAYYFVAVRDLVNSIAFYAALGLTLVEERPGLYALFKAGSVVLGLRQGMDAGAGVEAPGWTVLETARCEELFERIGPAVTRLTIRSEPHGRVFWFYGLGHHVQCFHDPEPAYSREAVLRRPLP